MHIFCQSTGAWNEKLCASSFLLVTPTHLPGDCFKSPSTSMQLYLEPFVIPSLFDYYFYERLILFLNCTLHEAYLKALIMRGMLVCLHSSEAFPAFWRRSSFELISPLPLMKLYVSPWQLPASSFPSHLSMHFIVLFFFQWSLQALWCPVLLFLWPWSSLAVIWSLSLPSPVMLIMQPVMWPWDHHFLKKKLLGSH